MLEDWRGEHHWYVPRAPKSEDVDKRGKLKRKKRECAAEGCNAKIDTRNRLGFCRRHQWLSPQHGRRA